MRRLAALAALALCCARPAQLQYEARVEEAPVAARHGVQSERIRELMRALDRLERQRLPTAMDVELERELRVAEVAAIALDLSEGADQLADEAQALDLEPESRAAFVAMARALGQQTQSLSERAPGLTLDEIRREGESIRAVCDACHARFEVEPLPAMP